MRKIAANYVFPVSQKPLKNGIIVIDDKGVIIDLIDTHGNLPEIENLEFYNGILVPGFINAHCHLELSHLKNKVKKQTGLPAFLLDVFNIRKSEKEEILNGIIYGDKEMQRNGIVAVGDISNNALTFEIKSQSKIKYHTFIEIYDVNNNTKEVLDKAINLKSIASGFNLSLSIIAHAPYTVSEILYKEIQRIAIAEKSIISTHNQECEDENKLYINSTGKFFDVGITPINFQPSGKNSLYSLARYLASENNKLLVHNTFTSEEDIIFASDNLSNLFWVMCPGANLYIENKLPEIYNFVKHNQNIALGTDSLASNNSLSILKELLIISENFPAIPLEILIKWATMNGAKALNLDDFFGSFEKGKSPGVNLIDNINFREMRLTNKSTLKVLL
jgi:aminodeoxyfutalosine deaminase